VVAGIVIGSVIAAAAIGVVMAYFLYNRYMAAKFAATVRLNTFSSKFFIFSKG
jgi:hypothetical protein